MDASGSERLLPGRSTTALPAVETEESGAQSSFPPTPSSYPVGRSEVGSEEGVELDGDFYDDDFDEEDEAAILAELEDLDLDETQLDEAMAMIES
eukprot:4614113-Pyramimonas_sp.AAC.1